MKYNISTKVLVGVRMDYFEELEKILVKNHGLLLTKDFVKVGISKQLLGQYVKKGLIKRIAHGVYLSIDAVNDELYVLQARSKRAVYSHETALFIHDLTDSEPKNTTVTVPSGYNATKLKESGLQVYFIKEELLELGVEERKTVLGRPIKVYDKERTLCDLMRNRSSLDVSIINEGIKRYLLLEDKDSFKLMKYAKQLRVESILRNYLEILL